MSKYSLILKEKCPLRSNGGEGDLGLTEAEGLKYRNQKTLSPRQLLFVKYYLESNNATEALKKAGYKSKITRAMVSSLLSHPLIILHIENHKKEIMKQTKVNFAWKVNKLKEIIEKEDEETINKIKAIEVLNKMQGDNAPEKNVNYNIDHNVNVVNELTKQYQEQNALRKIPH